MPSFTQVFHIEHGRYDAYLGQQYRPVVPARVWNGRLAYVTNNGYPYQVISVFTDRAIHSLPDATGAYEVDTLAPLWNGDFSSLSSEGQSEAGYVSPETIEALSTAKAASVSKLKSRAKKEPQVEPLLEEV